jgi:hypothetical protein
MRYLLHLHFLDNYIYLILIDVLFSRSHSPFDVSLVFLLIGNCCVIRWWGWITSGLVHIMTFVNYKLDNFYCFCCYSCKEEKHICIWFWSREGLWTHNSWLSDDKDYLVNVRHAGVIWSPCTLRYKYCFDETKCAQVENGKTTQTCHFFFVILTVLLGRCCQKNKYILEDGLAIAIMQHFYAICLTHLFS